MRRYQLSGLEHVHVLRHVPRSYDMTRTHIMHKGVNKHVDVVLRCSPKNWKKKKVAVSVVRGEKKNDAARIRANAKKGYVAVRRAASDKFEADRLAAAAAYETQYGRPSAGADALIHDMKSQLSTMAKKSADFIDDQLSANPTVTYPTFNSTPDTDTAVPASAETETPLISPESEKILKEGGYRMPGDRLYPSNPYATDYLKQTSDEEFHILMNSLEKSLDEACKKYASPSGDADVSTQAASQVNAETEPPHEPETENHYFSNYTGGYRLPNDVSVSVSKKQETHKEEKPEVKTEEENPALMEDFQPTLRFTDGGEHYIPTVPDNSFTTDNSPVDDLFDRELHRPGDRYVPPAYYFDDDDNAPAAFEEEENEHEVSLPDVVPVQTAPQPQDIFYTTDDQTHDDLFFGTFSDEPDREDVPPVVPEEESVSPDDFAAEGYPREDYEQQQVFFPTQEDNTRLYNPPENEDNFAQPTLYPESVETPVSEDDDYGSPMVFPDSGENDLSPAEESPYDDDEELPPPMIFPDEDEELPPPMIFPDEDEGYSPAPVSPDRNEPFEGTADHQGLIDRSGQTLFSRTGDQIKKVIGVIRGSDDSAAGSKKQDPPIRNQNVEITYSDRERYNR